MFWAFGWGGFGVAYIITYWANRVIDAGRVARGYRGLVLQVVVLGRFVLGGWGYGAAMAT